jgi:GntR family transcriptional regulator, transcriptional repressor for pyruvate dehydrogenase complex
MDLQDRILEVFANLGLEPGDEIPTEQELTEHLQVSRARLREALAVLDGFGVVISHQGARRTLGQFDMTIIVRRLTTVLAPTTEALLELLDVRRVLEVAFFPSAVANMSVKKIRHLRAITDRMHFKAEQGLPFIEEDAAFHMAIHAHLGNRTLEGLLKAFWQMFEQMSSDTTHGRDLAESARAHSRIVDALKAGDTPLAVHQLNVHFFDVRTRLTRQLAGAGAV